MSVFPSLAEHTESLNWLAHDGYGIGKAIELCEKVVIAKMTGHCLAGGLELALMCDLIYARESAKFGTTEINMGILPGWGGTVRIARAMPIFRAREIIYSGRKDYPAREMYEMGFLTRVFKDDEFEAKFSEVVANISSKKAIAVRMGKEVMGRSLECGSMDAALAIGTQCHPVADLCPGYPGRHGHIQEKARGPGGNTEEGEYRLGCEKIEETAHGFQI